MSTEKFDSRAEDLVLDLLKIQGHHYVMKADSSTNPDWDIIEFTENKDGLYSTIKYQVKGHYWEDPSSSHAIKANYSKLISDKSVNYLIIVIFKKDQNPDIYKFDIFDEIQEREEERKGKLFIDNKIQFSKEKDGDQTISLNTFYNSDYETQRENHKFLLK